MRNRRDDCAIAGRFSLPDRAALSSLRPSPARIWRATGWRQTCWGAVSADLMEASAWGILWLPDRRSSVRPRYSVRLADRRVARVERVACASASSGHGGVIRLPRNLVLVHEELIARNVIAGFPDGCLCCAPAPGPSPDDGRGRLPTGVGNPSRTRTASALPEAAVLS